MTGTSPAPEPPADAVEPVRRPDAPPPGEPLRAHVGAWFGRGGERARGLRFQRFTGRPASATGQTVRPDGPVAVRCGAVFIEAEADRLIGCIGDSRRARVFEVNP